MKSLSKEPWKVWVNRMNERVKLYSSSLYDVARENNCQSEVYECLVDVKNILGEFDEYKRILSSAAIDSGERERLVEEAFKSAHPYVLNFMKLLAKKRLMGIFEAVAEEYERSYLKDNNIERVVITTAMVLDEEKKKSIAEKIENKTGKKIIPEFVVDETILGGIVIRTENSNFDASVTGKIESLRRFMSKN